MFEDLNVLFCCRSGSHLYGTVTENSDLDLRGVFLEDLDNIILGKGRDVIVQTTGDKDSKNTKDDVDVEYKELRRFLKDAMDGQTYALDWLFCNAENTLQTSVIWRQVLANRDRLLSKNVKPFMGYCQQQAAKYGLRGSRLADLERVLLAFKFCHPNAKLSEYKRIEESEYVKYVEQKGEIFLEVLGKKYPLNIQVGRVWESLNDMWIQYGDRARLAKENAGIDWKAVSHAYRCMFELRALLCKGEIVFPLPEQEFLLQVKRGEIPWKDINDDLANLMQNIEGLMGASELPGQPDREFWDEFVLRVYRGQWDYCERSPIA